MSKLRCDPCTNRDSVPVLIVTRLASPAAANRVLVLFAPSAVVSHCYVKERGQKGVHDLSAVRVAGSAIVIILEPEKSCLDLCAV